MSCDSASRFSRHGVKRDMGKEDRHKKPFGGEPLSRVIRIILRLLVTILVWPFFLPRVEGCREEPSDEGCILIANHHHLFDPIFITLFFKSVRLCFIAKKELYNMKLIGWILKAFGAIPLDRSVSDLQASKHIISEIANKKIVGLFPPGTRVSLDQPLPAELHSGLSYYAIRRGIPIIPVGINPTYRLFGRPRFVFGDSVKLSLREGERLNPEEQDMAANEVMRRIYALAGLKYAHKNNAENEELFCRKIHVRPLESRADG